MRVESWSELAERFERDHPHLDYITERGVWIYPLELDGRLRIVMEYGEHATVDDMRDAITEARKWRDALLEWRGTRLDDLRTAFLERWYRQKQAGQTYRELADQVNAWVTVCLLRYAPHPASVATAKPASLMPRSAILSPLIDAINIMRYAGLKEKEIQELLLVGLKRVANGERPFEKGYPISTSKLRETLRSWGQSKRHRLQNRKATEDGPGRDNT